MASRICLGLFAVAVVFLSQSGYSSTKSIDTDLPTSELSALFSGGNSGKSYTLEMLELGMRMGAANLTSLRVGEEERAKNALSQFKQQYEKVASMVPSWKKDFPMSGIQELQAALNTKADLQKRNEIISRIEGVCTDCHGRRMFSFQARYRWGRFKDVSVQTDAKEDLSFHRIMLDTANGLGALRADVESGNKEAALKMYEFVKERFTVMELACANCHEKPRQYFIDASVKGRIFKLGGMLRKGITDKTQYAEVLNEVNQMSCLPCHQVHMPAAFLQQFLREQ